jgi:hypothetical protein
MPIIDLDALTNPDNLPRVRLFGREVVVKPLTGAMAHKIAIASSSEGSDAMLGAMLDVIKAAVPSLTKDEIDLLSVDQMGAIVQLSRGAVEEVETMLAERSEKN